MQEAVIIVLGLVLGLAASRLFCVFEGRNLNKSKGFFFLVAMEFKCKRQQQQHVALISKFYSLYYGYLFSTYLGYRKLKR